MMDSTVADAEADLKLNGVAESSTTDDQIYRVMDHLELDEHKVTAVEKKKLPENKIAARIQQDKEYEEQTYKRLMHLLNRSKFYSDHILQKISSANEKNKSPFKGGKRKRHTHENSPPSKRSKTKSTSPSISKDTLRKVNAQLNAKANLSQDEIEKELLVDNDNEEDAEEVKEPKEYNFKYFLGTLRDYQIEGFDWMYLLYKNALNGILADEMGLGKTVQVIALLSYLIQEKQAGPYLIIAPLSTIPNWLSEFERFSPELPVILYHGPKNHRHKISKKVNQLTKMSNGFETLPIVVTTYEIPYKDLKFFKAFNWRYIIIDEGQRIKNYECILIRSIKQFNSLNRLILTGTPLQNNLTELWSLLNFLLPDIFDNLDVFESWFDVNGLKSKEGTEKFLQQEKEKNIISSLREILKPFMLRREKQEACKDIPDKKEVVLYTPITELQSDLYKAVLKYDDTILLNRKRDPLIVDDENGKRPKRKCVLRVQQPNFYYRAVLDSKLLDKKSKNILETENNDNNDNNNKECKEFEEILTKCSEKFYKKYTNFYTQVQLVNRLPMYKYIVDHPYIITYPLNDVGLPLVNEDIVKASGKLLVLDAMLKKLYEKKHKVLLFSTLTRVLDILEDYLSLRPWEYFRLDGNTKIQNRKNDIKNFNSDDGVFLYLISTRAGGVGINLAGADTVIMFDCDWNPQVDIQAMARCHRIGQTRPVMIYKLCTRGTIDEIILHRSEAKRKLEKMVISKSLSQIKNHNDTIQELKRLLETSDLTVAKSDKEIFTDEELEKLLDRSDMKSNQLKENSLEQNSDKMEGDEEEVASNSK